MAIISCPECGRQVSDKALKCPQCAHPIANPETRDQLLPSEPSHKEPENVAKKWIILTSLIALTAIPLILIGKHFTDAWGPSSVTKDLDDLEVKIKQIDSEKGKQISVTYSMSDYNKITTGMSYSQVKTILGSNEGKELSRVDIKGAPLTVGYQWQNTDGSNIIVMFQDNAVTTKAQALLK